MHMQQYNLGTLFEHTAYAHAERAALCLPEHTVTYSLLFAWAQALAQLLIHHGCRQGDVIAIGHTKQPLSYALMLAAMRLGIPYVCLDVDSPAARTSDILARCGAVLLFYDDPAYEESMRQLSAASNCQALFLAEKDLPEISEQERDTQKQLSKLVDGATIAYIMFTSGSTGTPKGVAVTHQNLLHFITWGQHYFSVGDKDTFANVSPMYFDNSVFDFYVGLFSGAALSPIPKKLLTQPYDLVAYAAKMRCTIWFSVPSLLIYLMTMKAFTATSIPSLRHISFGGEGYPKTELKKLYTMFSSRARLVNVYGPTECTCICSAHVVSDSDFKEMDGLPMLGRLNQNFDYRIVDENDDDCALGELCLIGPNVAAGYFNDPERTAAAFHTLTSPERFMKRMYRTGDVVRKECGELYFVGRKDNQIKHMGYRIELEEIEHALIKLPHVHQAAALYHKTNTVYGKLIGFVACTEKVHEKDMLTQLRALLPEYMIPCIIKILDALPKNSNGKVDRQRLRDFVHHSRQH